MDQPLVLNVVEKLEGLLGKLPEKIRTPVLRELTPLKELFLQKRAPRFLFLGSIDKAAPELISALFGLVVERQATDAPTSIFRWQQINAAGRGEVSILDARGALDRSREQIEQEVRREPPDVIFFFDEPARRRRARKAEIENLVACLTWSQAAAGKTKVVGLTLLPAAAKQRRNKEDEELGTRLARALPKNEPVVEAVMFDGSAQARQKLMAMLGRTLPNQARLEMIRMSRDPEQQREVAQGLVKSTSAICAAIGAQPIPLADLPILTSLQLMMVSAIMYVSGRERSLRAATEFVGAVGANLGVAMLLREGVRAAVKFVPGWGNVVSGMVAGAGTYAIGRAAIAFFIEGASLKDARHTYRASRRKKLPHGLVT